MSEIKTIFEKMLKLMSVGEFHIDVNEENHRLIIFFENEDFIIKKNLPFLVNDLNHILQLISKKSSLPPFFIDINNYRLEREKIISELAKAAARKAIMTKSDISLPAMNAYERRIIHIELSMRPDIKTESEGLGQTRRVIVKPILD